MHGVFFILRLPVIYYFQQVLYEEERNEAREEVRLDALVALEEDRSGSKVRLGDPEHIFYLPSEPISLEHLLCGPPPLIQRSLTSWGRGYSG